MNTLNVTPIGYIKSTKKAKFDAPHQPDADDMSVDQIVLHNKSEYHQALLDLDSFSHIWLIWWFDKNKTWRPKVLPPRGKQKRRGVFATRSPHRPNPLAITAVPLVKVEKNIIYIGANDLIDGTAILDIKPYLPEVDSIAEANNGWLNEIVDKQKELYQISLTEKAKEQLTWLKQQGVAFFERAEKLLKVDPTPHRTRRIKEESPGIYRMSCAGWRIFYNLEDNVVNIICFKSGYLSKDLLPERRERIVDFQAHLDFKERY